MGGSPYYINPHEILKSWTLPQVIYTFLGKLEYDAANARQQFTLTMAAIGAVFSKDGKKIARKFMSALDGPGLSTDDVFENLGEDQKLILFGQSAMEQYGHKTDSDPDTD